MNTATGHSNYLNAKVNQGAIAGADIRNTRSEAPLTEECMMRLQVLVERFSHLTMSIEEFTNRFMGSEPETDNQASAKPIMAGSVGQIIDKIDILYNIANRLERADVRIKRIG